MGQLPLNREVVVDLKHEWKVFADGNFEEYSNRKHKNTPTIYFEVDPDRYGAASYLEVKGVKPFSVYLNYRLISFQKKNIKLNMDSLKKTNAVPWLFGVYQRDGFSWLDTQITAPHTVQSDLVNPLRPIDVYLDFSILASLILIVFFIFLFTSNPKLTLDYFNFVRLFSVQEREDALLNSRISASVNILYYIFCSLFCGLTLLTIFHFGNELVSVASHFKVHSTVQGFLQWLKLSLFIFLILMGKLVLLSGLAQMFDFREAPSPQFYNYVRLVLFICILSGFVCVCYFVLKIQSPYAYSFLLGGIILLLFFWLIIIWLKLLRRSPFRFFHLFSYLCGSELIPIVILVKVLNS